MWEVSSSGLSSRQAAEGLLVKPKPRAEAACRSVTYSAITVWNPLPTTITEAASDAGFIQLFKKCELNTSLVADLDGNKGFHCWCRFLSKFNVIFYLFSHCIRFYCVFFFSCACVMKYVVFVVCFCCVCCVPRKSSLMAANQDRSRYFWHNFISFQVNKWVLQMFIN